MLKLYSWLCILFIMVQLGFHLLCIASVAFADRAWLFCTVFYFFYYVHLIFFNSNYIKIANLLFSTFQSVAQVAEDIWDHYGFDFGTDFSGLYKALAHINYNVRVAIK